MKILIVDDDKMICYCLKTILDANNDMEVVAMGHNYNEAIDLYEKYLPDICLFDIQIGEKTGLDAFRFLQEKYSNIKTIFLTTFLDRDYINQAIKYKSNGYILKDDFESIAPAIRTVMAGQSVFGKEIISELSNISTKKKISGLTQKEEEIVSLVAKGYSNKEIATELYLSEGTVRNYISNILNKLDIKDRTNLAIYYLNS